MKDYPEDAPFSHVKFLRKLGAHKELIEWYEKVDFREDNNHKYQNRALDNRPLGDHTEDALAIFRKHSDQDPLAFYAGSYALNPVPAFIVGRIGPNLFGGFMSGLVHT